MEECCSRNEEKSYATSVSVREGELYFFLLLLSWKSGVQERVKEKMQQYETQMRKRNERKNRR